MGKQHATPIEMVWNADDRSMRPINDAWARRAAQTFDHGAVYNIADLGERSQRSHNHYFAALHAVWLNLSEESGQRFPTSEHLRKHALIKAGYCDVRTLVCASRAEALRVAAFMGQFDDYAIITASGATVYHYTAQSQSIKAMGGKLFQKSKQDVLDILPAMIGVTPDALERHLKAAA